VSVRITAAERDALYDQVYVRLSGIDELWLAAQEEDWEKADRLAREYTDDLRLVLEDLGWGESGGEVQLTASPDVLRRVLLRMQERAEAQQEAEEEELAEGRQREEQRQRVMQACRRVLAEL
jgi:hypothetical protein